jgi:hypothetical protein
MANKPNYDMIFFRLMQIALVAGTVILALYQKEGWAGYYSL